MLYGGREFAGTLPLSPGGRGALPPSSVVLCRKGLEIVMNRLIASASEQATPSRIRRTTPGPPSA